MDAVEDIGRISKFITPNEPAVSDIHCPECRMACRLFLRVCRSLSTMVGQARQALEKEKTVDRKVRRNSCEAGRVSRIVYL